jgi:hypothetical protein
MQNHEEIIIHYIDTCDLTDDVKAIFISILLDLYSYCHANYESPSSKTVKQLFPNEAWEKIDENDRNTLGKHVPHLVKLGGLPLTDTGKKNSRNHRLYIINKQGG